MFKKYEYFIILKYFIHFLIFVLSSGMRWMNKFKEKKYYILTE